MVSKAPADYFCPVTRDIMADPVQTADGETYERASIEEWFARGKTTSPLTNAVLAGAALTPNKALKRSISTFLEKQVARVKEIQASHIKAYGELKSLGPAAATVLGDDDDWFEKGRERLRSGLAATDGGKKETDAVAGRLQQLEREQIGMHNTLQQLELASAGGGRDGSSGGVVGWLSTAAWLLLELLFVLSLLIVPLACLAPETLAIGRVGAPLTPPVAGLSFALAGQAVPPAAARPAPQPQHPPPPSPPPPPAPPCEDDRGDGQGVLVEGSDCASYLLFPVSTEAIPTAT